jgi:fructosamine-3-kinase
VLHRCGGGDINDAWHVTLADGRDAFVKSRADAADGEYAREAAGLRWLAEPRALQVPSVLEVAEHHLALEWVEPGQLTEMGAEELGRGLAAVHSAGAPHFGDPRAQEGSESRAHGGGGGEGGVHAGDGTADTRFGSLALPNHALPDWAEFYADCRLRPLARKAAAQGWLTDAAQRAIESICEHLGELAGPREPAARLHGDLWSGNVLADTHGRPWLIDPAVYGGHREVDLAMLRLFGAPSERVFAAYEEVAPLGEGWSERVALWQLAPMLVHGVLFGGGYCEAAERIARHYAR